MIKGAPGKGKLVVERRRPRLLKIASPPDSVTEESENGVLTVQRLELMLEPLKSSTITCAWTAEANNKPTMMSGDFMAKKTKYVENRFQYNFVNNFQRFARLGAWAKTRVRRAFPSPMPGGRRLSSVAAS
jgi:hypothetical protein